MPQVEVSYVVSLYNRPDFLAACLWSIKGQTHEDYEVIVTDNTEDKTVAHQQKRIVEKLKDKRFRYLRTAGKIKVSDCYWSSEVGLNQAKGKWVCFPCEDCYYPPQWTQRMLTEAVRNNLDLVLCESTLTGPETCGIDGYRVLQLGKPGFPGYKPSFLVKRAKFKGWLNKPLVPACSGVDRTTLQDLTKKLKWGVARDLMYVHN